ncbi:unnamed protein product [Wuchereria bancrofti]|uniref:Uncharacterized protein n=1 Tax=Wuchereria bancrofti TaxID=6293 RepID=A0A3P7E7U6_WUCBA|nr:unnamed protein product [Wuchereria bancrofti]
MWPEPRALRKVGAMRAHRAESRRAARHVGRPFERGFYGGSDAAKLVFGSDVPLHTGIRIAKGAKSEDKSLGGGCFFGVLSASKCVHVVGISAVFHSWAGAGFTARSTRTYAIGALRKCWNDKDYSENVGGNRERDGAAVLSPIPSRYPWGEREIYLRFAGTVLRSDEEVRQSWADVDECVRIVESWPQWKRDACHAILSPASIDQWDDECSDVGYTHPG